jgi:hypothetical protein
MSFVVKYDLEGIYIWSRFISGFNKIDTNDIYDQIPSLSINNNNIYITSSSSTSVIIYESENNPLKTISLPIVDITDDLPITVSSMCLIINCDINGNYVWCSVLTDDADTIDIFTDDNYLYITGAFLNTINFYDRHVSSSNITNPSWPPLIDSNFNSVSDIDINVKGFIAKYTLEGVKEWCRMIGNGARCYNICADNNNVYVIGTFINNLILYDETNNPQQLSILDNEGTTGFISQYSLSGIPIWNSIIKGSGDDYFTNWSYWRNFGIYICTDSNYLYASDARGYVALWAIGEFIEKYLDNLVISTSIGNH